MSAIESARGLYVSGHIDLAEFERRVSRALSEPSPPIPIWPTVRINE